MQSQMRQRFLIYFSYIGTNYNGMQSQIGRTGVTQPDTDSIQGILEFGLRKVLRLTSAPPIWISSRTDQGVHALESAAQFDYRVTVPEEFAVPERLCQSLNLFLEKNNTEIRIRRIVQVAEDFRCRSAYSRTYLYRLAVCKRNDFHNCSDKTYITAALPISELNRCEIVPQPFEPTSILEACKLFVGTWNFRTFAQINKRNRDSDLDSYVKTVRRISFNRVNSFRDVEVESAHVHDPTFNLFDFYDIHVEGSGFLRRQVRRMVGAILGVASGNISVGDIRFMLENPGENSWNTRCNTASAHGLYLKKVNYKDVPVIRGPLC